MNPPNANDVARLVYIVTQLRKYQKAYFRERSLTDLQRAKVWENRADEWIQLHGGLESMPKEEPKPVGPQQGELFG